MAAIILAGGMSERMGQDKALLPFGETTLLQHVVNAVRRVADHVIVVADIPDKYSLPDGTPVIGDLFPGAGPLGGITAGLMEAGEGYHCVVACDMPHLNPGLLQMLRNEASGYDAAVPEVRGRLEPLCAVYHQCCIEPFEYSLSRGNRAVHKALDAVRMRRVPEDMLRQADPRLASFTNINEPSDLRVLMGARDEWQA